MAEAVVDILIRARSQAGDAVQRTTRGLRDARTAAQRLSDVRTKNFEQGLRKIQRVSEQLDDNAIKARQGFREMARVGFRTINRDLKILQANLRATADAAKQAGERLSSTGEAIRSVGLAAVGLGAAIAAPAAIGISRFAQFEKVLSRVGAITAGITRPELEALTEEALRLGRTTEFTGAQAAEGLIFLAQAGLNARQQLGALEGTLQLASAGQIGLAEAADIATNVLQGLGRPVEDLGQINDILAFTASNANTNVSELGQSFKVAAPAIAATGQSAESAAAFFGLLANNGIKGAQAGTAFRNVTIALSRDIGPAAERIRQLGVETKDAEGNLRPVIDVLEDLRKAGAGFADNVAIFGRFTAVAATAASAQTDLANALEEGIIGAEGFAKRVAELQLDNVAGDVTKLGSAFDGLFNIIGQQLAPVIRPVIQAVTAVVSAVADLAARFSGATKVISVGLLILGSLTAALGTLLILIGSVVVGVGRLRVALAGIATSSKGAAAGITLLNAGLRVTSFLVSRILLPLTIIITVVELAAAAVRFLGDQFGIFGAQARQTTREVNETLDGFKAFNDSLQQFNTQALDPALQRSLAKIKVGILEGRIEAEKAQAAVARFLAEQKRLNDALIQAEQELAIVQEQQAQAAEQARIAAAKRAKEEEIRLTQETLTSVKRQRTAANTELKKLERERVKIIADAEKAAADARRKATSDVQDLEQQIREIRRSNLSERQQQADIEKEINERISAARLAALRATTAEEIAAAQQQIQAVAGLAQRLDSEKEQVAVLEDAVKVRQSLAKREQKIIEETRKADIEANRQRQIEQKKQAEEAEAQIPKVIAQLKTLKDELADIGKDTTQINFEAQTEAAEAKIQGLRDQLEDLNNINIVVEVERVAATGQTGGIVAARHGGQIPRFRQGGGKLPGFGGGDRVHALLEAGEYVVRKERVRQFGPLIAAINGANLGLLRRSLPRMQVGGFVSALPFQTGGVVPTPEPDTGQENVTDVVRLDLSVNGREIGPVTGEKRVVDELLDVLGKQGAALATG